MHGRANHWAVLRFRDRYGQVLFLTQTRGTVLAGTWRYGGGRFAGKQRKNGKEGYELPGCARGRGEVVGVDEEGAEAAVRRLFLAGEDVAAASSGSARSAAPKPARQHHEDAQAQHECEGIDQRARDGLPSPESGGNGGGCGVSGGRLGRPGGEIGVV